MIEGEDVLEGEGAEAGEEVFVQEGGGAGSGGWGGARGGCCSRLSRIW